MKKNKLSIAQQRIVRDLRMCKGAFIQGCIDRGIEWDYLFAGSTEYWNFAKGKIIILDGLYQTCRFPYRKAQETIRCLIRKKVLIPIMADKEFAIQLALGSIDYRIYKLAKEYE